MGEILTHTHIHCGNGEGYLCSLTKDKRLSVIGKISARNGCEIHGTVLE